MAALGRAQCKGKGRRGGEKVEGREGEAKKDGEERKDIQDPAEAGGR